MTRAMIALCLVLLAGCKSSEPGAPTAADEQPRAGISLAFQEARRDFTERLAQHAAKGWPDHVTTSGEPPRPTVRVGRIVNRTREMVDAVGLRDALVQDLIDQGLVDVVLHDDALADDLAAERDFAGVPDASVPVSYLIDGTLEDEVSDVDGLVTTVRVVVLRMTDARDRGIAVQTRTETRSVRERS